MAPTKAIKATKQTRRVPEDQVPAELRGLYNADKATAEEVSLDFDAPQEDAPEVELENLFKAEGVWYTIPKEFSPSVGLIYLDRISSGGGRDEALGAILKAVIGPEGWAALMKLAIENKINMAQMKAIISKVNNRTMGALEDTEGNS